MHFKVQIRSFLFLMTFFFIGCKNTGGQQKCLESYISELEGTPEYNLIRSAAKDTVIHWASLNIESFDGINRTKWEIDSAVFFNEDKTKALLLLLEVDTASTAKLDYIKLIAADRKENRWHYYTQGMHLIYVDREENPKGRPFTFQELSQRGRRQIVRGGYYESSTCIINFDYVNDWFNEPLAENHKFFLQSRIKNKN